MKIQFSKMHALGNDFMVIDGVSQSLTLSPELIRIWSDRQRGIGFDQLLVVESTRSDEADFYYRIFNANGAEVAQCGNGARCIARFIYQKKLTTKPSLKLQTQNRIMTVNQISEEYYEVNLGVPTINALQQIFVLQENAYSLGLIDVGNPHAVLFVNDIETAPVTTLGPLIENHPWFPHKTNVEFMQIIAPDYIELRVWERGVGETQACGSGAVAAAVCGIARGQLNSEVKIRLPGGLLQVKWAGDEEPVWLTGSTTYVFEGEI